MAAPITHIVLANKLAERYFSSSEINKILVGTSLPDIRYITNIPRNKTHLSYSSIKQIDPSTDSFTIGFNMHSLVDNVRDKFYESKDVYKHGGDFIFITALKFFEDKIFYHKFSHWDTVSKLFASSDDVVYENIDTSKISVWYKLLSEYIIKYPSDDSLNHILTQMGFNKDIINLIFQNLSEIEKNEKLVQTVNSLYESLDTISNS